MSALKTLDRGLAALGLIASSPAGISIASLAERLGVARAIIYRVIATLEEHAMVARGRDGLIHLGPGAAWLASNFEPQLRHLAAPVLQELAERCRTTAFLSVAHGDECTAVMVAEPEQTVIRVGYRLGSRHQLTVGAGGHAILALRPAQLDEPVGVKEARRDGVAVSYGQLQHGAIGVAAGFLYPPEHGLEASLGVVALGDMRVAQVKANVLRAVQEILC